MSIDITKKTATGITLEDGTKVTGDYVIPAVDTHILFEKLPDKKYMPKILKKAYENEAHYPVMSGLQAAYALEGESSIKHNRLFECRPFRAGRNEEDMLMIQVYDYEPIYVRDGRCVIQSHIMQGHEDYKWWKSLTKEEYDKAKAQAAASGKFAIQRILKAER